MNYQTYPPHQKVTFNYIAPKQTHSANLIEIKTGQENLENCDGLWSRNSKFCLGVRTADCAPIVFSNNEMFGIIHAGWRGCLNGIIENMLQLIAEANLQQETVFHIGPLLPKFEIQKDDCYDQLFQKFGDQFFESDHGKIIFNFKACLIFLIPNPQFDPRSTFENKALASWRRDHNSDRNLTVINPPKKSLEA